MTQKERQIENITMLMKWNRFVLGYGIALTKGKDGLLYNPITGEIRRLRQNKYNQWILWGNSLGRLDRDYLRFMLPSSSIHVYNHIVAGVALGLFDNVKLEDAYINHKNYNGCDNCQYNLEVCTNSENVLHGQLRVHCINLGIWIEGVSIEAKIASLILKNYKGNRELISRALYKYLNKQAINKH